MLGLRRSMRSYVFKLCRSAIQWFLYGPRQAFGTYRLCEQRRFRRACASAQSRQNLRCSLIQAVNQEEPSYRKPDPWPLWMAGHAQLKFVMTECSKTQIRLTGLIYNIFTRLSSSWDLQNFRSSPLLTRCLLSQSSLLLKAGSFNFLLNLQRLSDGNCISTYIE